MTNRDRLRFLQQRLRLLDDELQRNHLEDEYSKFLETIVTTHAAFKPLSDDEWDVMLPKERNSNLIRYYHSLRSEFLALTQAAEDKRLTDKLREWLENPWVHSTLAVVTVTEIAIKLLEMAHMHGLLFRPEEEIAHLD